MGYKMGRYKDITSVKTIKKVEIAKKYYEEGFSVNEIAEKMALSPSRIRELLKGVNWDSKAS